MLLRLRPAGHQLEPRCIGKMPGIPSAARQKSRTLVEISEMMRVCMQVCCKRNIVVVGVGYIGRTCSPFTDRKRWKSRRSGFKSWSDGQTVFIGKGTNEMYNDIHYMEKGHIARTKVLRTKLACTPALVTMSQLLYLYFFLFVCSCTFRSAFAGTNCRAMVWAWCCLSFLHLVGPTSTRKVEGYVAELFQPMRFGRLALRALVGAPGLGESAGGRKYAPVLSEFQASLKYQPPQQLPDIQV